MVDGSQKGGKEVMIKSILLALPTYVMSTFLLPLEICENLASAITILMEFKSAKKRNTLDEMGKCLSTKRRGRDWLSFRS